VVGGTIWRLKQGASAFELHPIHRYRPPDDSYFLDVLETPEGNLWASGNSRNLVFFDARQGKAVNFQQELEQIIPHQVNLGGISLDKQGSIWVASSVGLLKVTPKTDLFNTWFTQQNDACQGFCSFRGFAEDNEGNVFASFYSNIFQIKQNGEAIERPLSPTLHPPYDLLFHDGKLLMNDGTVFDPKMRTWGNPFKSITKSIDIGVLAKNGKGQIWQTNGDAFYELDLTQPSPQWKFLQNFSGQGFAADMAFDAFNQQVWVCNASNLRSYEPASLTFQVWRENDPEPLQNPKCLYPDGKGKLWIGTEQGLVQFDYVAKTTKRYTQAHGLPNDNIVGILPEGDSCLWLSTFNGLARLSIATGKFVNFFKQDGLADNEFNRASFFKASDGRMFFGGTKGITGFYPKQVMLQHARQASSERLLLRSISMSKDGADSIITDVFHSGNDRLEVYHYNRTVNIEFGVFSANEGGQPLYSYRLEGGQVDTWSAPSKNNTVTFYSLPPGKYLFRAKALNARGQWLSEEIALPLIVHPPWWATWWAYLLYALALAAIAYGIFHFLKKRLELKSQLRLEQQEAERLKELDAFKSRLYTNLTHEFRTPLTVILGMAEELAVGSWQLAVSDGEKQRIRNGLGLVSSNGQNLLRLVNQLLDLSKLEDKSFKLNLRCGDIVPFLRYVTESFQSLANSRNLSLRFFTPLENLEMDFDPEQVQQVLGNLLSNALKFTPAGGEVSVGMRNEERGMMGDSGSSLIPPPSSLVISVTDTGIGIPEANLPHVFDRFYQVDGSSTRPGEGTGIGLAHAQELVKLMGGEISVESSTSPLGDRGAGTTFTVRLPVVHSPVTPPLTPKGEPNPSNPAKFTTELPQLDSPLELHLLAEQMAEQGPPPSILQSFHPSILVIEDNPDVVTYLKTILQDRYEISIAYNGRIGIEKALEQIPDLIISDVMMPEKDGYQVLDALKHDERTSHIPIILLTAKADASSKIAGLRRGADAYLSKPFQKAELLATLEMMLENKLRLAAHFSKQYGFAQNLTKAAGDEKTDLPPDAEAVLVEDAFLQKIRQIVEANYGDEAFALPQLCEAVSMSRSQLFRKMKALTDVSPSDFIRNYRMAQAKLLLETTQLPVKEVAWRVGYKEVPHFSKTFQDTYGMPPSAVRK
jgi:signal transduction histidine kinase/CheY-like chemotaxis protein/AraC-like DNA-binding protein/streptogramin lyase